MTHRGPFQPLPFCDSDSVTKIVHSSQLEQAQCSTTQLHLSSSSFY